MRGVSKRNIGGEIIKNCATPLCLKLDTKGSHNKCHKKWNYLVFIGMEGMEEDGVCG